MDKAYIDWCTKRLDQTDQLILGKLVLEDSTLHGITRYAIYSNGYKGGSYNYAYALMKNEEFQAMRIYGLGQADYKYVQYIVGVGLQVVSDNGDCILVNKTQPLVSPRLRKSVAPPLKGLLQWGCFGVDVEVSKWENLGSSSILSLYGLSYATDYYEIVCLDLSFGQVPEKCINECIETLGLYGRYYRTMVSALPEFERQMLIIAKSEEVFLKYYGKSKWTIAI